MSDLVVVGRFGSPFGIKGWIKVVSFTDPIDKVVDYLPWTVIKDKAEVTLKKIKGQLHGGHLIVKFPCCDDRDTAKNYTNLEISIKRTQLPHLTEGEYYWVDLIGLKVINQEQIDLGQVESLLATGSNDVFVVREISGKKRYIPYLGQVVLKIDLPNKMLLVDWDSDF